MLSEKSAQTVRATLPAVGAAIGEITGSSYGRLFAAHPELLRDLFNRGNQAAGTQRQALAGSIAAFATALVEHPEQRPDAMLARIAHKHASLGVTAEQYHVVHEHLFAAIVEILGEAVTPEVAAAWDEVYWLMANALIAVEQRLYEQSGTRGERRPYVVAARTAETADVATFLLHPADGGPVPAHRPGQYVSVQVELPDGARQIRQYSLSGNPDGGLQITVKRVAGDPAGEVSTHLHRHVDQGATLLVSAPFGDVRLDDGDRPVLLASAGIGCTPIIGMLGHLAETGATRRVIAVHGDRQESAHAFREEFEQLVAKLPNAEAHVWYERPEQERPADRTGRVDLTGLEVPADAVAYLCGPLPFMRAARTQLLAAGVPAADIHYEVFGPDLWLGQDS
ncbi:globin domain-containing protein [Streptomyces sp. TLI_171]|uniref:globin domain-containing protein n=1 Tax=Streptomyces sp. TLI_171 TaxID=1938859 RepID=UPI000C18965F|nr:globin domain-containing protein [Streptomyces sp. TLI_171]RKE22650.1 nitric oxide dioxygenase [Streptomyces sp. TLI_171]